MVGEQARILEPLAEMRWRSSARGHRRGPGDVFLLREVSRTQKAQMAVIRDVHVRACRVQSMKWTCAISSILEGQSQ